MRGARGFALSVALPVFLFAGVTVVGQAISPARGQSLLPTLADITTVNLPGGNAAEVYLEPGSPGVNAFHMIFLKNGNAASVGAADVTASRNGGNPEVLRLTTLSTGHFISYTELATGAWRFDVTATIGGHRDSFSVSRRLS
jgi:hypothetical protein